MTLAAENGARGTSPSSDPPMNKDGHVLKSRRGFLAAGLAAVMVGTLGVVSTVDAGAEEIPGVGDTDQGFAVSRAERLAPPPLLPWGEVPKSAKVGPASMTSRELRAYGLQAAPATVASDSTQLSDLSRRKGLMGTVKSVRDVPSSTASLTDTQIAPPSPPAADSESSLTADSSSTAAATSGSSLVYLYAGAIQEQVGADGVSANFSINKPTLTIKDDHTLAELAVQSSAQDSQGQPLASGSKQTIEVGWSVSRSLNGDADPHLFVFHWINGQPTCYNACGFRSCRDGFCNTYSSVKPGDRVALGFAKLAIYHSGSAWWIAYGSEWIGYYPDSLWSNAGVDFTKVSRVQTFGEVAAASTTTCTQMGNGINPDDNPDAAASFGTVAFYQAVGTPVAVNMEIRSPSSGEVVVPFYGTYVASSRRTVRYGGWRGASSCPTP